MEDKDNTLMWAIKTGDLEEVKAKITAEDINRTLEGGRKPLHHAADCGHTDVVEFLISKGADVNAVDKHNLTPLLAACLENQLSCVKVLLEKGADKKTKAPDGKTPLELAETEAMRALLE